MGFLRIFVTGAQIQVMTFEGSGSPPREGIWALYSISGALVPQSVFFSDRYRAEHEMLSAEGKIKHTLDDCHERLKPIVVRDWSPQEGWKNILLPPIESKILNSAITR